MSCIPKNIQKENCRTWLEESQDLAAHCDVLSGSRLCLRPRTCWQAQDQTVGFFHRDHSSWIKLIFINPPNVLGSIVQDISSPISSSNIPLEHWANCRILFAEIHIRPWRSLTLILPTCPPGAPDSLSTKPQAWHKEQNQRPQDGHLDSPFSSQDSLPTISYNRLQRFAPRSKRAEICRPAPI